MESSEFDKTIQQKLNGNNSLHQKSILDSKANIWANVQPKSTTKTVIFPWYYSAVAALLLLFGCSILFYKMNQNYRNDLHVLSAQIHQLNNRPNQVEILEVKNKELDQLCAELEKKAQVTKNTIPKASEIIIQRQIVHRIDTVFLKQTEYIVQNLPNVYIEKDTLSSTKDPAQLQEISTNRVIFFDNKASNPKEDHSTASRIKLVNFKNN